MFSCRVCGDASTKSCGRCKEAKYCGKRCQKRDWKNGHQRECRPAEDPKRCKVCGAVSQKRCSRCKDALYCGRACQKKDWKTGHRQECRPFEKSTGASPTGSEKWSPDTWVDIDPMSPGDADYFTWRYLNHLSPGLIIGDALDGIERGEMMLVKVQIAPGSTPEEREMILLYPEWKRFEIMAYPANFDGGYDQYSRLHDLVNTFGYDTRSLGLGPSRIYLDAYVTPLGKLRVMMDKIYSAKPW